MAPEDGRRTEGSPPPAPLHWVSLPLLLLLLLLLFYLLTLSWVWDLWCT